jgi:hypothetical protein
MHRSIGDAAYLHAAHTCIHTDTQTRCLGPLTTSTYNCSLAVFKFYAYDKSNDKTEAVDPAATARK